MNSTSPAPSAASCAPHSIHPQVAAAEEAARSGQRPWDRDEPTDPREQPVWELLKGRTEPLVSVAELEIRPRDKARVLCRMQLGTRAWDLHLDQWGNLRIGLEALNPRSGDHEDRATPSAPYADVVFLRYMDHPRGTGWTVTKYGDEFIFSLRRLTPKETAEVAFQFGLWVGARGNYHQAIKALFSSPAFQIACRNLRARTRKLKPLSTPDYWDWREAAATVLVDGPPKT